MKKYRKFIASIMGVTAMIALRHYDVQIPGVDSVVLELIVGALTSAGVYQVPNEVA